MNALGDNTFAGNNFLYGTKLNFSPWIIILYCMCKILNYDITKIKIMYRLWGQYSILPCDPDYFIKTWFHYLYIILK